VILQTMPDAPRYIAFRVAAKCEHCTHPLVVNGLMEKIGCPSCRRESRFYPSKWAEILAGADDDYGKMKPGRERSMTFLGSGIDVRYRKQEPLCGLCRAPIPAAEVKVGTDADLACPGCGGVLATYPAPPWITGRVASARQVYGADREGASKPDAADGSAPRALTCPQCGAALSGSPGEAVHCSYCRAQVTLPDPRRAGAPVARFWFVRFEGPTRAQLAEEKKKRRKEGRGAARRGRGRNPG